MDFYDKDGNIVHYEGKKLPKKSSRSDFYEIDENTWLKVFISFLSRNIRDIDVFKRLMEINHDNFYQIYKYYIVFVRVKIRNYMMGSMFMHV